MNRKWFSIAALIVVAISLLSVSSCGDPQELVSIQIEPSAQAFGASNIPLIQDVGLQAQLTALGNYVHPPVTKDITDQVTWASSVTQVVTVSSTGQVSVTGTACGGSLITATVQTNADASGVSSSGAVVSGS
ncbi:MAG: Ig-like domain-containing protein, partial [Candidatus Sulfotelmatobacter sp.]